MAHNSLVSQPLTPEMRSPVGSHSASTTVLKTVGVFTAVAGAEILRTRLTREDIAPRIDWGDAQTDLHARGPLVIAAGGLCHATGDYVRTIPSMQGAASIVYGSTIEPKGLGEMLGEALNHRDEESVSFVGHSLGLKTLLLALTEAVEMGYDNMPPIGTIWGISSPLLPEDVRRSSLYGMLPKIVDAIGGPGCKVLGAMATQPVDSHKPLQSLWSNSKHLVRNYRKLQTPRQWATHLNILYGPCPDLAILQEAGMLTGATDVRFSLAEGDPVVYESSVDAWTQCFALAGQRVEVLRHGVGTHGDGKDLPEEHWRSSQQQQYATAA